MPDNKNELEKINHRLLQLEQRLSKLESMISPLNSSADIESLKRETTVADDSPFIKSGLDEEDGLEVSIGRFGLAWMGNIVLLFGIVFLIQYMTGEGLKYLPVITGYVVGLVIFFLSRYLKKTNSHLSNIFRINSLILLFYTTFKLHFFSPDPLLTGKTVTLILLLLMVLIQGYFSARDKSQSIALLSVVFGLITAIFTDSTHFMLLITTLVAASSVFLYSRYNWSSLLFLTLLLTYATFSLWLFGNPVMGHPLQMIPVHNNGIYYLFCLGGCYSLISLFRKEDGSSDDFLKSVIITNGLLFTMILSLVVLRFYSDHYVVLFAVITVFCLLFSTFLNATSDWNFATAYFALYGFMAMSISLYGIVGLPNVYLLLSVQSLFVVSMALWFGNRLIIVMNSFLFIFIMLIYLFSSNHVSSVNFSFAIIALVSARIINWKKSRLQIKTDLIRNLYLAEGFLMILYALLHGMPKQFVTFSWTIAASVYFLISLVLKNVKYRYMALATLICAAFYLFLVDLARIELIYRVLALLFLAALSIGISIYYTQRIKKTDNPV